jgi:hypothetical protein
MLHENRFELRNFLEALNSIFEDIADRLHNVLGQSAESGNQLTVLQDKIEHVKRLRVLVFLELGCKPPLSLNNFREIVSSRHQIG